MADHAPETDVLVQLRKEVAELKAKCAAIHVAAEKLSGDQQSFHRMLYAECGQWSRHFSAVRMTVTTFLISTSLGITAFAWKDPGAKPLMLLACAVWGCMVAIYWLFTVFTWGWYRRQGESRDRLIKALSLDEVGHPKKFDLTAVIVALLSACFAGAQWYWFGSQRVPPADGVKQGAPTTQQATTSPATTMMAADGARHRANP